MKSVSFATRDFICWDPQRELVRLISNGVESRLSVEVRQKHDSWLPHFLFQSIAFPTNQLEGFSTECLRTKTETIITANHSKGKYHQEPMRPRIKKRQEARENACDKVAIDFSFECDRSSWWRKFSKPITERNKAKSNQTRTNSNAQLKIAPSEIREIVYSRLFCAKVLKLQVCDLKAVALRNKTW